MSSSLLSCGIGFTVCKSPIFETLDGMWELDFIDWSSLFSPSSSSSVTDLSWLYKQRAHSRMWNSLNGPFAAAVFFQTWFFLWLWNSAGCVGVCGFGGKETCDEDVWLRICSAKVFESKDRNSVLTWMNIHPYTDLQLHTVSRSWQIFYIIL